MAKPTALIILLAIALQLTFPLSNESTLGTAGKKFAGQGQFPASSGIPLFFIAPRLTKPRTTTTILVSCPRKHTRFRIQVPASIATLSVLYHASPRCTGSHFWCGKDRVMARPRTSKCYSESNGQDIERGMRDRINMMATQHLNFRMITHLLRLRHFVFDRGKGWWRAKKNSISGRSTCLAFSG